jgi:hypothetical protein
MASFAAGLLITLVIAVVISQFASSEPDGLEYVAEHEGFSEMADDHAMVETPLADYGDDNTPSLMLSGLVGVLVTLGLGYVVFSLAKAGKPTAKG